MRIVLSVISGVAALLGPAPTAMAGELLSSTTTGASAASSTSQTGPDSQAGPQTGVSVLAVSLTAGGAVAAAGSGVAAWIWSRIFSKTAVALSERALAPDVKRGHQTPATSYGPDFMLGIKAYRRQAAKFRPTCLAPPEPSPPPPSPPPSRSVRLRSAYRPAARQPVGATRAYHSGSP